MTKLFQDLQYKIVFLDFDEIRRQHRTYPDGHLTNVPVEEYNLNLADYLVRVAIQEALSKTARYARSDYEGKKLIPGMVMVAQCQSILHIQASAEKAITLLKLRPQAEYAVDRISKVRINGQSIDQYTFSGAGYKPMLVDWDIFRIKT